jgi:hypothetical protein
VKHEKKDSTVSKDVVSVHKDSSTNSNETVIDFGDRKIYVKDSSINDRIYFTPKNPNDYFTIDKEGNIKTNVIPKSVVIKGKQQQFNIDSLADHSKITDHYESDKKTKINIDDKNINRVVHKTGNFFLWAWIILILILVGYIIIKNRKRIWAWIIHRITGL